MKKVQNIGTKSAFILFIQIKKSAFMPKILSGKLLVVLI